MDDRSHAEKDRAIYDWATTVLFEVRKQRSEAKQPVKVPITKVSITAPPETLALMPPILEDLKSSLRVQYFDLIEGASPAFAVAGYDAPPPA